jgi:DNA replication protein DnaC
MPGVRRCSDATIPWDKSAKVTYDRRVMNELVSLRFVEDHRNAVILGPVGVGKTFLANALGHLCCRAGFHVRLLRADALLRLLKQSRMHNSREAVMTNSPPSTCSSSMISRWSP